MDINCFAPKNHISAKELINLKSISPNDILELVYTATELKTMVKFGEQSHKINGKNIILISKSSLGISRIAFEIATRSIGGNPIPLQYKGSHIEELMKSDDSIKVINRFGLSAVVVDTSIEADAETLSKNLDIPVINANEDHSPCQALAAILSIWENRGRLQGLKAVVIGNVDVIDNSLIYGFAKCGIDVTIVSPEEAKPSAETVDYLNQFCVANYSNNLEASMKNADIIFGFINNFGENYLVTQSKMQSLCPNALFLANIPLICGSIAEREVVDSPKSLIYEQGENILHVERAAIYLLSK